MNRKRLEGELIRDNVLAVSGLLNPRLGGKPVRVPIDPEVYDLIFTEGERDFLWPVTPGKFQQDRRSLYLLNKRSPTPAHDGGLRPAGHHDLLPGAARQHACAAGAHAVQQQLHARAVQCLRRATATGSAAAIADFQLRRAFKLALARAPKPVEMQMGREFFSTGGELADFCLALMNRNEFVYVP